MEYQKIDQNRLRAQVEVAVKTGNFRNAELGQYVSDICKKVLSQKCYVGYTEDSKVAAEFDITEFVHPGDNLFAFQTFRWCDG